MKSQQVNRVMVTGGAVLLWRWIGLLREGAAAR